MGINLSISKEFIEIHGDTIAADSMGGEGTPFTIQRPIDGKDSEK